MGYVNQSPPSFTQTSTKSAFLYSIDGGVNYSSDSRLIADNQASSAKNMWLQNGIITSRPELAALENAVVEGMRPNSVYSYSEHIIIHSGAKLYSLGEEGLTELLSELPDARSIAVEFSGVLYIYCSKRVYSVTRDMKAEEVMPYAPLYMKNCSGDTGVATLVESDFKKNIFAPYISVAYRAKPIDVYGRYRFPLHFDKTRKFEVYFEDKKLENDEYTYDDSGFTLNRIKPEEDNTLRICFYSTDSSLDTGDELAGCTVGTSFGGGTLDGTRVILAGNSEHPGKYYSSELANGLYFKEDSGGVIGPGTEDITAFSKQYGYLMIFTANTVSRMSYNFTSENGGYYSVKTINSSIGCDISGSVAVIDNRTVFANSTGGVFIVDTVDNYDGLNIVPISRNIMDASKENGYFSVSAESLKKAVCCLNDRRYVLLAGEKIFIWDFGEYPYVSSSDYVKSAKKLIWFEFDGLDRAVSVMSLKSGLYLLKNTQENQSAIYMFDTAAEHLENTVYEFSSKNMDMDSPHTKKAVTAFRFECKTEKETDAQVKLYADGEMYHSFMAHIVPDSDGYAVFAARLPKYVLEHFLFSVRCLQPGTGIFNIALEYMILKSNLKR